VSRLIRGAIYHEGETCSVTFGTSTSKKKKGRVLAALPCDARLPMSMTAATLYVEQFIHGPGPDRDAGVAAVSHW
jgi:hypothetical protein